MDNISIYYQNCHGLRTKRSEFYQNLVGCSYDFICLTETWFTDSFNSYSYFTDNYFVYRKDRSSPDSDQDRRGGGVLIAVNKKFKVHRRFDLDFNNIECVWVVVKLRSDFSLLIGNNYLPPTVSTDVLQRYADFLSCNIDISLYKILCVGDFNLPKFNWYLGLSEHDNSYIKTKSDIIYSLFCNLNVVQQNFHRISSDDNILDLVCSSFPDELSVSREQELVTLDRSHPSLLISFSLPVFTQRFVPIVRKNFARGDFVGLFRYLSSYQYSVSNDPDVLTNDLHCAITCALDTFIPDKVVRPSKYPHWFSFRLINLLRSKEKYHRKIKKHPNNSNYKESFKYFRKLCKKTLDSDEKKFKCKIEADLCNNPRFFWQYIKTQYKNPHQISILDDSGQSVPEHRVPEVFAEHFTSVYSTNSIVQDVIHSSVDAPVIPQPVITVADVTKAAKTLKSSRVAGSDNVPAFILKGCIDVLAPVLCNIFNMCISSRKFPTLWKTSIVVPVPKNSQVNIVKNYRPVALLTNFSKLFEKIIVNHLSFHVRHILTPHQHGFLKGRSTVSNLSSYLQFSAPHVLDQKQVDTVYFDLSRAFDLVNHDLLLNKLLNFGLSPSYVHFLRSYLSDRFFRVKVGNFYSDEHSIPSGVIQGSNIGPLLFIIFFDDVKNVISSQFEAYADDLKVSRVINEGDDIDILQKDIDSIVHWCDNNSMQCNVGKTVVVSFTRKKNMVLNSYKMAGIDIKRSFEHKDLGIYFDSKLNFNYHMQNILSKGRKCSALVYWVSKNFRNPLTIKVLFGSLVRSRLEYCSEVWNGLRDTDSKNVEQVQKNFLRRVTYHFHGRSTPYNVSLDLYGLTKLSIRRNYKDVLFLYKIINGLVDCLYLLHKINFNIPRLTTRHPKHFKLSPYENSKLIPMNRYMHLANLYPSLDLSQSLYRFIENLKVIITDQ